MTAAEAGKLELMDVILGAAKNKMELLAYSCDSGSPLHAAITGEAALESV